MLRIRKITDWLFHVVNDNDEVLFEGTYSKCFTYYEEHQNETN